MPLCLSDWFYWLFNCFSYIFGPLCFTLLFPLLLFGMSTWRRCCETFIGCRLRNASILSWLLIYRCLHCTVWRHAQYLSDYIQRVADSNRRRVRSSSSSKLVIRRTRLSTVGDRAFPVAGSRLWNSLPPDVTSASTLTVFRNRLKTHLFSRSFPS